MRRVEPGTAKPLTKEERAGAWKSLSSVTQPGSAQSRSVHDSCARLMSGHCQDRLGERPYLHW